MKVYPIDIITRDVKTALDFNKSGSGLALLGDTDTLSLNEIIKSKIIESVKNIHAVAPAHLLDSGNNFSNNIYWKELYFWFAKSEENDNSRWNHRNW